jgi:hypothetical protein
MRPPTILATLVLSFVLAAPLPASASTPSPESRFSEALRMTAEVRELLATPSVTAAVLATARASGVALDVPAIAAPGNAGEAIASITTAVEQANRIIRSGARADHVSLAKAIRMSLRAAASPAAYRHVPARDPSAALRASAILAAAIDASMPALRSAGSASRSEAAVACDVLDQTPNLCVGGLGSNTYTAPSAVFIDLGGDDTYAVPSIATGALGVGLVVDAAGNDSYVPPDGAGVGSGAVGVGMVVDGAGDDLYRAASSTGSVGGQGLGVFGGAGFLVDGAGNDRYQMTSTVEGGAAGAAGQGEGFFGGVAALVDGQGNDRYEVDALALPKTVDVEVPGGVTFPGTLYGSAAATAQGAGGFGGVGILSDGGGTDVFRNDVGMGAADPALPIVAQQPPVIPSAVAGGQGNTILAGMGLLLEGAGTTTYDMHASLGPAPLDDQNAVARVWGQGMATGLVSGADSNAQGVLNDAGGDDTYSLSSSIATSTTSTIVDGCPCSSARAMAGSPTTMGQGYGMYGGQGIVADTGGNDRYAAESRSTSTAIVHDQRTSAGARKIASATAAAPVLVAQGGGGTQGGQGLLRDAAGDDRYHAEATSDATTDADSVVPANNPTLSPAAMPPNATAQGAGRLLGGSGTIMDLAGSDTYEAVASALTTAGSETISGAAPIYAQGSVNPVGQIGASGTAIDLDGIGTDTYVQSPALAACSGTRGTAVWQDCSSSAYGVNA